MTTTLEAQLPDGRCVRLRELTTAEQSRAWRAAAPQRPNGTYEQPNPVDLNAELLRVSVCAVTTPRPLYRAGDDGKPLARTGSDGLPMMIVNPATGAPVLGHDGKPRVALQRFDLSTLAAGDWRPVTYGELNADGLDRMFPAKARVVLDTLFARLHSLRADEDGADFFETIREVNSTA